MFREKRNSIPVRYQIAQAWVFEKRTNGRGLEFAKKRITMTQISCLIDIELGAKKEKFMLRLVIGRIVLRAHLLYRKLSQYPSTWGDEGKLRNKA
ncbi:hypothetical protein CEXT_539131 [Caerostris extrusa]|uniref:Uncharacterized protein n=1 Tax=Caerostris extrusa TaxID=172846 RepID=A0AAV4P853_CAEEX|nr:hypothetical protein CEXT_539131 [Caerostris extrusa]